MSGSAIVVAYADKITDERTDDKERTAVHTGHGVINDNYPILEYFIWGLSAENLMVEVQKSYEISLTFTKTFGDCVIVANNDIPIFIDILIANGV